MEWDDVENLNIQTISLTEDELKALEPDPIDISTRKIITLNSFADLLKPKPAWTHNLHNGNPDSDRLDIHKPSSNKVPSNVSDPISVQRLTNETSTLTTKNIAKGFFIESVTTDVIQPVIKFVTTDVIKPDIKSVSTDVIDPAFNYVAEPINKAATEHLFELVPESVSDLLLTLVTEPATELLIAPVPESVSEILLNLVTEPVTELLIEPVSESVSDILLSPVTEAVSELLIEPDLQTVSELVLSHVTEPVTELLIKSAPESVTEPLVELAPELLTEVVPESVTGSEFELASEPEPNVEEKISKRRRQRRKKAAKKALEPARPIEPPKPSTSASTSKPTNPIRSLFQSYSSPIKTYIYLTKDQNEFLSILKIETLSYAFSFIDAMQRFVPRKQLNSDLTEYFQAWQNCYYAIKESEAKEPLRFNDFILAWNPAYNATLNLLMKRNGDYTDMFIILHFKAIYENLYCLTDRLATNRSLFTKKQLKDVPPLGWMGVNFQTDAETDAIIDKHFELQVYQMLFRQLIGLHNDFKRSFLYAVQNGINCDYFYSNSSNCFSEQDEGSSNAKKWSKKSGSSGKMSNDYDYEIYTAGSRECGNLMEKYLHCDVSVFKQAFCFKTQLANLAQYAESAYKSNTYNKFMELYLSSAVILTEALANAFRLVNSNTSINTSKCQKVSTCRKRKNKTERIKSRIEKLKTNLFNDLKSTFDYYLINNTSNDALLEQYLNCGNSTFLKKEKQKQGLKKVKSSSSMCVEGSNESALVSDNENDQIVQDSVLYKYYPRSEDYNVFLEQYLNCGISSFTKEVTEWDMANSLIIENFNSLFPVENEELFDEFLEYLLVAWLETGLSKQNVSFA